MAFTGDLGRVQGGSSFHTMAASSTSVAIGSLQPQLTPFVGDAVQFPNGDVRQITAVSGSTVTLGDVLFSYKGDAGTGNATLSNIDGDSTENGFTQAAVKGVAQAKNYYNLGVYDTYVSNGDGTGTITRRTAYIDANEIYSHNLNNLPPYSTFHIRSSLLSRVNRNSIKNNFGFESYFGAEDEEDLISFSAGRDITIEELNLIISEFKIQAEYKEEYQYTETVIENQPLNTLDQNGSQWLREEWEKGLNLCPVKSVTPNENIELVTLPVGTYTFSLNPASLIGVLYEIFYVNSNGQHIILGNPSHSAASSTFTLIEKATLQIYVGGQAGEQSIMIVKGKIPYPYKPYEGEIVREKDLSGIQLFPENVNPAETVGGDWLDLGTVTVGSTTLHAYQKLN